MKAPVRFLPQRSKKTKAFLRTISNLFPSRKDLTNTKEGAQRASNASPLPESSLPQARSANIIGIANMGNTCYMNAVLQSLLADRTMIHSLGTRLGTCSDPMPLSETVIDMVGSGRDANVMSTQGIQRIFAKRYPWFEAKIQQDAHEFLTLFLELLGEELSHQKVQHTESSMEVQVSDTAEDQRKCCTNLFKKLKGLMKLLKKKPSRTPSSSITASSARPSQSLDCSVGYYLSLQRVLECPSCASRSEPRQDTQLGLMVSIPENPRTSTGETLKPRWNLETLLWQSFEAEFLEKKCDNCPCVKAILETKLSATPRRLVVQIKRFARDGTKVKNSVKIPEALSLEMFFPADEACPSRYRLCSVVRHISDSCKSGHYVADILQENGSWICCNDQSISQRYCSELQDTQGYLCFYKLE